LYDDLHKLIHEQYHVIIEKNKLKHIKYQKVKIVNHRYNHENIKHYRLLNIKHLLKLIMVTHSDQLNGTHDAVYKNYY
jgi:hypothetical protein